MQTFLPFPDYLESMRCLDKSRLGNQVWREGLTLIRGGWSNHPSSKMWKGYEYHLGLYLMEGLLVLFERGKYYSEVHKKIEIEMSKHKNTGAPPWLGNDAFHKSHQSNLLRKNPEHYSKYFPGVPNDLPYIWPSIINV